MLFRSLKMRTMPFVFSEVPFILRYDQKGGATKMKVFETVRRTLLLMFDRKFRA